MPSDVDRIKSGLVSLIRRTVGASIIRRVDYLAIYPCKVVMQNGDGTLELFADDNRVGTLSSVPIRYGVPGVKATVPPGARCYLAFGGGDPSAPLVVDWESGTALTLTFTSDAIKLGGSGSTEAVIKGTTFKSALDTLNTAWDAFLTGLTTGNLVARAGTMLTAMQAFELAIASTLSTVTKTS